MSDSYIAAVEQSIVEQGAESAKIQRPSAVDMVPLIKKLTNQVSFLEGSVAVANAHIRELSDRLSEVEQLVRRVTGVEK